MALTANTGQSANHAGPSVLIERGGHEKVSVFSIGAMNSEGMLSRNPTAGIHRTEVARTIDANGSNPASYQGGDLVVIEKAPDGGVERLSTPDPSRIPGKDGGTSARLRKR